MFKWLKRVKRLLAALANGAVLARQPVALPAGLALWMLVAAMPTLAHAEEYLAPEVAFKFSARMADATTIEVNYAVADGYYMYRDRFHFKADGAKLGQPQFPHGKVKYDDNFQKEVETYHNNVSIRIPVEATAAFRLTSTAQGCADKGLCYPPMDTVASLSPKVLGEVVYAANAGAGAAASGTAEVASEMDRITAALRSGKLLTVLSLFLLLGIGLSFTPCVLPM